MQAFLFMNDLGEGMRRVLCPRCHSLLVLSREGGMMGKGCGGSNPGGANLPSQQDPIRAIRGVWSGSFERHS